MGPAAHVTLIACMPAVADTQIGQIMAELQRRIGVGASICWRKWRLQATAATMLNPAG
jgi:hypothetical protein